MQHIVLDMTTYCDLVRSGLVGSALVMWRVNVHNDVVNIGFSGMVGPSASFLTLSTYALPYSSLFRHDVPRLHCAALHRPTLNSAVPRHAMPPHARPHCIVYAVYGI